MSSDARESHVHRMTRLADRLRNLKTCKGMMSQRVFLVWSTFSGEERGEGVETIRACVELIPRPKVIDLSAIGRRPYSGGVFKEGSLRLEGISGGAYTRDMLLGLVIPIGNTSSSCCQAGCGPVHPLYGQPIEAVGTNFMERTTNIQTDFWYEIIEDGRGDNPAAPLRFRVLSGPSRRETNFDWVVILECADEPRDRMGAPQMGVDPSNRDAESDQLGDDFGPL